MINLLHFFFLIIQKQVLYYYKCIGHATEKWIFQALADSQGPDQGSQGPGQGSQGPDQLSLIYTPSIHSMPRGYIVFVCLLAQIIECYRKHVF